MATKGYFIITDISGYTEYLTKSELEHAHETLQSLSLIAQSALAALPGSIVDQNFTPNPVHWWDEFESRSNTLVRIVRASCSGP